MCKFSYFTSPTLQIFIFNLLFETYVVLGGNCIVLQNFKIPIFKNAVFANQLCPNDLRLSLGFSRYLSRITT